MTLGSKIIVLGCSGSGKSSFAKKLRTLTGLPLIHLDNVWWKADRSHISREEFDRKVAELLSGDRWIVDGDYSRTYEVRIKACDTVVFLDYDEETCMKGILGRVGERRTDIPWTEERLDPELAALVRGYHSEQRPRLLALLEQYPEKRKLVFQTRGQADQWLSEYDRESKKHGDAAADPGCDPGDR